MEPIRLIFADNVERYRKVIIDELNPFNIRCVAEAGNGKELLRLLRFTENDIVLLDLEMPVMDGNEAFNRIMDLYPQTRVIIFSNHYELLLVEDYIRRGAKGYIPKDEIAGNIGILVKAIETIKEGKVFIHHPARTKHAEVIKYSLKQKKIAPMICQGFTNEEIAEALHIQVRGVEKQRSRIYSKIGGGKAIDFYRYAFSKGLHFLEKMTRKGGTE